MKNYIAICFALATMPAFGQKVNASKVPATAKTYFSKNFPTVTNAKWEIENGSYEANFKEKGNKMSATFDNNGNWMETESKIKVSELPKSVIDYVAKNYADQKIKGAAKLTMAKGVTNYEAEIKGKDLIFDSKGGFIKEIKD